MDKITKVSHKLHDQVTEYRGNGNSNVSFLIVIEDGNKKCTIIESDHGYFSRFAMVVKNMVENLLTR